MKRILIVLGGAAVMVTVAACGSSPGTVPNAGSVNNTGSAGGTGGGSDYASMGTSAEAYTQTQLERHVNPRCVGTRLTRYKGMVSGDCYWLEIDRFDSNDSKAEWMRQLTKSPYGQRGYMTKEAAEPYALVGNKWCVIRDIPLTKNNAVLRTLQARMGGRVLTVHDMYGY